MKEAQARLRPPAPSEAEWREYVKWHAQAGYQWALEAVKNLEPLERAEAMAPAPPAQTVHWGKPRQNKPFVGRDLTEVPVDRRQAPRRAPKPAKPASDPSWLDHEARAGVPVVDLYPDKVARDPNVELRAPLETLPNWTRDGRRKPRLGDADTLEERPFR